MVRNNPILSVNDLRVSFQRWGQQVVALSRVSFDVISGEWLLVVGHNGAGKSTLLNAIATDQQPTSGQILLNERDVKTLKRQELASRLFRVHQDPAIGTAPLLTVFENLFVADPKASSVGRSALVHRYAALLEPIGLADRMRQPAKILSGGERQLLAVVIASIRETPILLLDEPLAALDPVRTGLCISEIARMHRNGKTIIQVAHDIRALTPLANRIITLSHGCVEGITLLR